MKIRFNCNSGANIHSKRSEVFTPEELGFTEKEWLDLHEDDKHAMCEQWANDRLEIFYEEID